jgi:predicted ATPase
VTGASSSGKSTLVEALLKSNALGTKYERIAEIARELMAERGWTTEMLRNDENIFEALQIAVMEGQYQQECKLRQTGTAYISDRGLDALAFIKQRQHIVNVPAYEAALANYARPLAQFHQQALVLLVQPVETFLKDDGTRLLDSLEKSQQFNAILHEELKALDVHPFVLPASCHNIEHRVQFVAHLLRQLGNGVQPRALVV